MSSTILKLMLLLGIIGHACNMYCDRILSIFPNGQFHMDFNITARSVKSLEITPLSPIIPVTTTVMTKNITHMPIS